jgi:hypothetical protein
MRPCLVDSPLGGREGTSDLQRPRALSPSCWGYSTWDGKSKRLRDQLETRVDGRSDCDGAIVREHGTVSSLAGAGRAAQPAAGEALAAFTGLRGTLPQAYDHIPGVRHHQGHGTERPGKSRCVTLEDSISHSWF